MDRPEIAKYFLQKGKALVRSEKLVELSQKSCTRAPTRANKIQDLALSLALIDQRSILRSV